MTLPALLRHVAHIRSGEVALRAKQRGIYRETTWSQMLDRISHIALGLHALGVGKGDRVAIVGDPLPEWLFSDLAAQCIGAVSYGLYPTSSRDEVEYTLRHGGASILIAEDQEHVDKVLPALDRLPQLRRVAVIDDSGMFQHDHPALMSLADLIELGSTQSRDTFDRLCRSVRPDDPGTIVYTSGTSAHPKGAVYTHRALIAQGHQFFAFPELAGEHRHPQRRASAAQSSLRAHEHADGHAGEGHRSPLRRGGRTLHRDARRCGPSAPRLRAALLVEARLARDRRHREQQRHQACRLSSRDAASAARYRRRRWRGRRPILLGRALRRRPLRRLRSDVEEARAASRAHRAVGRRAAAGRGAGAVAGVGRQPQEPLRPDRRRRGDGAVRTLSAPRHRWAAVSGR